MSFTFTVEQAWCENCGTVSQDGHCHCTDHNDPPETPNWKPYDQQAYEFIAELRALLREADKAIDHFISALHPDDAINSKFDAAFVIATLEKIKAAIGEKADG